MLYDKAVKKKNNRKLHFKWSNSEIKNFKFKSKAVQTFNCYSWNIKRFSFPFLVQLFNMILFLLPQTNKQTNKQTNNKIQCSRFSILIQKHKAAEKKEYKKIYEL